MSITGKDTRSAGTAVERVGPDGWCDGVDAMPDSAAGCMRALALNGADDTSRSPTRLSRGGDSRQSPKPDVLDAIRSLMMAPVSSHRTRRKP